MTRVSNAEQSVQQQPVEDVVPAVQTSGTPLEGQVSQLNTLIIGVIIVLSLALGGFLTNSLAQYQSSYTDLRDEVKTQNDKIDNLINTLQTSQNLTTARQQDIAPIDMQQTPAPVGAQ